MSVWRGEARTGEAFLMEAPLPANAKRPSCSVTTLLRKWQRGITDGANNVPCGNCNACCRSPRMRVTIGDAEAKTRGLETFVDEGGRWLAKKADGSCVYLIDGKCSIYGNRPGSCRTYDCRASGLLLGWSDLNDPIIQEALSEWEPLRTPLPEDRDTLLAIRMAILDGGIPQSFEEAYRRFRRWPRYVEMARKARPLCELVLSRTVMAKAVGESGEEKQCLVLVAGESTVMVAVKGDKPNTTLGIVFTNVKRTA